MNELNELHEVNELTRTRWAEGGLVQEANLRFKAAPLCQELLQCRACVSPGGWRDGGDKRDEVMGKTGWGREEKLSLDNPLYTLSNPSDL